MAMEAHVTISGLVGTPVEFGPTQFNTPQATFRLGCTPRVSRPGGWGDGKTIWISVFCRWSLAENVAASIGKGDAVLVQGKLRNWTWPDKNGEIQDHLVIEASSVGHDLFRGTSTFQRTQRAEPAEESDRDAVELITKVEDAELHELIEAENGRGLSDVSS